MAKRLRRELSEHYGEEWGAYVSLLGALRTLVLDRVPGGEAEHKPIFTMLTASDLYERVAAGGQLNAEAVYEELVVPFVEAMPTPLVEAMPVSMAKSTGETEAASCKMQGASERAGAGL